MTRPSQRRTARLHLRQWEESDRQPFAALNADPEVMRHFPTVLCRSGSDALLDRLRHDLTARGWGLWALQRLDTGELIGFTGLAVPRFEAAFTPCVEVGWRLARSAWGQGLATEAARAAVGVAFGEVALEEVVSFTSVGNSRSRAVMSRLGMTHDPVDDFDHPSITDGDPLRRHVLYRLGRPGAAPEPRRRGRGVDQPTRRGL